MSELDDAYKRQRSEWDAETTRLRAELSALSGSGGGPPPSNIGTAHAMSLDERERADRYGSSYGGSRRGPDGDIEMHDRERDVRDRDRGVDRDLQRDREMRRKEKIPKSERTYA